MSLHGLGQLHQNHMQCPCWAILGGSPPSCGAKLVPAVGANPISRSWDRRQGLNAAAAAWDCSSLSAVQGQRCAHAGPGEWAACVTPSLLTKACNEEHSSILVQVEKLMRVQKGNHCICTCGLRAACLPRRLNMLPKNAVLLLSPVGTSPGGRRAVPCFVSNCLSAKVRLFS